MTFAEKFKAARERRGLTQQQVADGLGLNRRMITRYETGRSFPRTKEAYRKIADFFGLEVNYLLTEDEAFVVAAAERYGGRGMQQAQDLIDGMAGLFAGGTLSDQDKDAVMKALQDIYWESKARSAAAYTPRKFRKTTVGD
ncbi:MAG TPA: helix-turn-helix transcriptional regulator [Candidatus Avoscillospira stercorigallinarum]|uniref:Helix-turn-helix transcriptional regulator n=1 Tax=Candidatus Avoscillospira stercorigallinarum TaxID=2840708 RepID=A0A9D0Z750_9FIRM|nr:helix-turn-helix transcriptional regulator [Candidatus Avoscillospira stercorigallinarum]